MEQLTDVMFSGHETFTFRHGWMKKGFDATETDPGVFNADEAMTVLGVGKNMVRSIRHWCLAAGVLEEYQPDTSVRRTSLRATALGRSLFAEESGWDPYMEDPATAWLLHWQVTTNTERCTTWFWAFSHVHEPEFSRDSLTSALARWVETAGWKKGGAISSLKRDVECFVRTYLPSRPSHGAPPEDSLDCPLTDLGLIVEAGDRNTFQFNRGPQHELPDAVLLHAVLTYWDRRSPKSETFPLHYLKLGKAAKAVYTVLSETRQPDQLLFKDLPVACGAEPFGPKGVAGPAADAFFGTLRGALVELQQAYPRLQAEVGQLLVGAFKLTPPVGQARPELTHKAKLVSDLAVDAKLKGFIARALDTASDDQQWVESLASLLVNKPTRSWGDEDRAKYEVNLALTARTFHHFHALAFDAEQGGAPILDGDATALRVGVTLPNRTDIDRVVRIPTRLADRADALRVGIRRVLADAGLHDQPEVSAAVLAQVVRDLLAEDEPDQTGKKGENKG